MKQSVLVIESEPWLGQHFERLLAKSGFHTISASNAYSAIDVVDQYRPSVIIMSLLMSGVNGLGLLHELQSYVDTAKIPVIVCAGANSAVSLDELRPYGVRRILNTTTMRPDDIVATVRSVLHLP